MRKFLLRLLSADDTPNYVKFSAHESRQIEALTRAEHVAIAEGDTLHVLSLGKQIELRERRKYTFDTLERERRAGVVHDHGGL